MYISVIRKGEKNARIDARATKTKIRKTYKFYFDDRNEPTRLLARLAIKIGTKLKRLIRRDITRQFAKVVTFISLNWTEKFGYRDGGECVCVRPGRA